MTKILYSPKQIKEITGAARHEDIKIPFYYVPPFLDILKDELLRKLRSSGGRPTIPEWDVVRKIRFSNKSWNQLEKVSNKWSNTGHMVSPSQVASIIFQTCIPLLSDPHETPAQIQGVKSALARKIGRSMKLLPIWLSCLRNPQCYVWIIP